VKVLLDENLPHGLRELLVNHEVFTVAYKKWQGLENGALMARAADAGFDVMVTIDAGIEYERNLGDLALSVVLIRAATNTLKDLEPLVPALTKALDEIGERQLVHVG
jgi:hypothetical protein